MTLVELAAVGGGALVAVLASWLAFRGLFRVWRTPFATAVRQAARWPWRLSMAALGAFVAIQVVDAEPSLELGRYLVLTLVAGLTWLAVAVLRAVEHASYEVHDTTVSDNLLARRRRTQVVVLRRVGTAITIVLGLALALLTFPAGRAVGQSFLASAGLLALVAGIAGQATLRNLVAGIQIAVAQPIRLGDAVVVDGEWGTVEDITLSNVVIAVWDRRRLIYPTSWFTENAFQNWTRSSSQLLGVVTLVLDHRCDVAALRSATGDVVAANPRWDGEAWALQVVEADAAGITVRVLATARDGPTAFDLRCDVREQLVAWLVANDPDALPVRRIRTEP